jgi:hypothetical protein
MTSALIVPCSVRNVLADRLHARLLEQRDASAPTTSASPREPGRMDRRAVRVRRAELTDDVDAVAGGGGVEPSFVVLGEAERALRRPGRAVDRRGPRSWRSGSCRP